MVGVVRAVQGVVPEPGAGRQAAPGAAGCLLLRAGAEAEAAAGAAGAAAARGQRGAQRAGEWDGGRRPIGTRTDGLGFPSCVLHLPARAERKGWLSGGGPPRGPLSVSHPKFAISCNPTGCWDRWAPTLPRFSSFAPFSEPSPIAADWSPPLSSLQSRSLESTPLPSEASPFSGGRPEGCPRAPGE